MPTPARRLRLCLPSQGSRRSRPAALLAGAGPPSPAQPHRAPGRPLRPPRSQDSRCAAVSSRLCRDFLSGNCGRFRSAKPAMLTARREGRARARQRRTAAAPPRPCPLLPSPPLAARGSLGPVVLPGTQRRGGGGAEVLIAAGASPRGCGGGGKRVGRSLMSQAGAQKEIPRGSQAPRAEGHPPTQGIPRLCRSPQPERRRPRLSVRRVPTRWSGSPAPVVYLCPVRLVQVHLNIANKNQIQSFLFR